MEQCTGTGETENSTHISDLIEIMQRDGMEADTPLDLEPYIEIVEQPKPKVRFRYECEGRSAGSILGVSATNENKSYPTIRIRNRTGLVFVVVSLVTKEEPYKPHPHKLVGKDNCSNGVYSYSFENDGHTQVQLTNLGIQCMKKNDIVDSLEKRRSMNIDPFKTGFDHMTQKNSINLNAVRLCIQAFFPKEDNTYKKARPVVSDPIFDAKSNSDLVIHTLSHVSASVAGGTKVILLCDKVSKEDIKIRFFEEQDGATVWESYADFLPQDVHKQYAIVFRTPRYKTFEINEAIDIQIQLENSKKVVSDPYNFKFTPLDSEEHRRGKRRNDDEYYQELDSNRDPELRKPKYQKIVRLTKSPSVVKVEPPDSSPNPHHHHQYLYPPGPSGISPYHPSRTPSPSTNIYQQPYPYSPEQVPNFQGAFVEMPCVISPSHVDATMLDSQYPPLPLQSTAVYVSPESPHHVEHRNPGGATGTFPNYIINLDTQQINLDSQQPTDLRSSDVSLSAVNSKDLIDATGILSQNLNDSLVISETNPDNISGSCTGLTQFANQTFNKNFA